MFTKTDAKITRYADGKWFIDIVRGCKGDKMYLGHEDYRVTHLIYGLDQGLTDEQCVNFTEDDLEFHKSVYEAEVFDPDWDEEEQAAFDRFTEEEYTKHLWSEETREVFDMFTEEEQRKKRMRFNEDDNDLPFY